MAAALMDELMEAILLRISSDDLAGLVRAALVCKRWCRIISNPGFRHRFRELHPRPAMLGFLRNQGTVSSFVPTSSFRPPRCRCYTHATRRNFPTIDARHGRVLLHSVSWKLGENPLKNPFVVWDPIAGERRELPLLPWSSNPYSWNAAVLCASTGACNHLDCRHGPFLVVLVGTDQEGMFACVYSSEAAAWSERTSAHYPGHEIILMPSALVGNALYFMFWYSESILKYDLGTHEMTVIPVPVECSFRRVVLMTRDDGELGLAYMENLRLYLWSMVECPDDEENVEWAERKVIELRTLLPDEALSADSLDVAGFADGASVIFVRTDGGLFTIDLESYRVTRVCGEGWYYGNFPYVGFCTPALEAASTIVGPATGTSNI
ncbi:uncharacterized protein LOC120659223 [Panicum virgatum]|uniref:uncharacterized protein LOC120659223 n=1 Tax=Panicum virgatum TaxID=38727 RepID=UPI0019D5F4E1|nr:uncharacterized protein LOC120659223 [Panicum virgatum]